MQASREEAAAPLPGADALRQHRPLRWRQRGGASSSELRAHRWEKRRRRRTDGQTAFSAGGPVRRPIPQTQRRRAASARSHRCRARPPRRGRFTLGNRDLALPLHGALAAPTLVPPQMQRSRPRIALGVVPARRCGDEGMGCGLLLCAARDAACMPGAVPAVLRLAAGHWRWRWRPFTLAVRRAALRSMAAATSCCSAVPCAFRGPSAPCAEAREASACSSRTQPRICEAGWQRWIKRRRSCSCSLQVLQPAAAAAPRARARPAEPAAAAASPAVPETRALTRRLPLNAAAAAAAGAHRRGSTAAEPCAGAVDAAPASGVQRHFHSCMRAACNKHPAAQRRASSSEPVRPALALTVTGPALTARGDAGPASPKRRLAVPSALAAAARHVL